jgi:hypothetical protein
MNERQQNSATFPITFVMVSSTDHSTKVTGVTPTVTLSKNGLPFGAALGAVTEIGSGWYALAGNTTDRNTLGELSVHATAAGADDFDTKYVIIPWDPFNGANLGMGALPSVAAGTTGGLVTSGTGANQLSTTNGTVTAGTIQDKTGYTVSTVQDKTGYSLATPPPTAAAIAGAVWEEAKSGHTTAGTYGSFLDAAVSGITGGGGSSSDPWATDLVAGNYTGNTAGAIVRSVTGLQTAVKAAGSPTPTRTAIPLIGLSATLPTTANNFLGQSLEFQAGPNVGQRKTITGWQASNPPVATFDAPGFPNAPAADDAAVIV